VLAFRARTSPGRTPLRLGVRRWAFASGVGRVAPGRRSGLGRVVGARGDLPPSQARSYSQPLINQPAPRSLESEAKGCVMAKNVGTIEHRGPIATPGRTKTPQVIGLVLSPQSCHGPEHSSSRAGAGHTTMSQATEADSASSYAPRGVLRDYEVISTLGHGSFGKVKRE